MSDVLCMTCGMWSHLECCHHVPKLRLAIAERDKEITRLKAERDHAWQSWMAMKQKFETVRGELNEARRTVNRVRQALRGGG